MDSKTHNSDNRSYVQFNRMDLNRRITVVDVFRSILVRKCSIKIISISFTLNFLLL